jgi:hypothetical protein
MQTKTTAVAAKIQKKTESIGYFQLFRTQPVYVSIISGADTH